MNFAPGAVGDGERGYAAVSVVEMMQELAPDLVFVFSRKIQWGCPWPSHCPGPVHEGLKSSLTSEGQRILISVV